jgi:ParB family chromosome partitioning protein
MSDIQTLVAQTLHDMRAKAKIEGPWKLHEGRYSLQMGGGGARSPWYLRTIDETRERWPAEDSLRQSFDAIEVPVSTDLEISPRNGGNGFRFSVAFGLTAPFGEETPIQGFPWQFSASTPDVGIAESHSSENEESGHPCTCSGNPDCPKCGGFGFVGGFAPTGDGTEFPIQARKPLRASQRLAEGEKLFLLPLALIGPNPEQPRKSFSDESLDELANSILIHGVIQPIVVEAMSNLRSTIHAPGRMRSEAVAREIAAGEIAAEDSESIASPVFRIIAGERRYRAALRAGLDEIPAIIRKIPSERRVEISLIENIQREDLNPVDEAEAFRALMDLTGKTQDEVAETVGKSRSFVANALRLLKLAPRMLAALRAATITAGHSRALLVLSDASARDTLFDRILDESLSVREAEESARKMAVAISCGGNEAAPARPARAARRKASTPGKDESRDPLLAVREESLIRNLGSKVSIRGSADRGILELEYGSAEELNRIVEAIGSLTRG